MLLVGREHSHVTPILLNSWQLLSVGYEEPPENGYNLSKNFSLATHKQAVPLIDFFLRVFDKRLGQTIKTLFVSLPVHNEMHHRGDFVLCEQFRGIIVLENMSNLLQYIFSLKETD